MAERKWLWLLSLVAFMGLIATAVATKPSPASGRDGDRWDRLGKAPAGLREGAGLRPEVRSHSPSPTPSGTTGSESASGATAAPGSDPAPSATPTVEQPSYAPPAVSPTAGRPLQPQQVPEEESAGQPSPVPEDSRRKGTRSRGLLRAPTPTLGPLPARPPTPVAAAPTSDPGVDLVDRFMQLLITLILLGVVALVGAIGWLQLRR